MATINLSAWDVATMFGLSYSRMEKKPDKWGDIKYWRIFDLHGKIYEIDEDYYDIIDRDSAQERIASDVLYDIGKMLAQQE